MNAKGLCLKNCKSYYTNLDSTPESSSKNKKEYAGETLNGKFHGKGVLFDSAAGTKFSGEFKNGSIDGFGILEVSQGKMKICNWSENSSSEFYIINNKNTLISTCILNRPSEGIFFGEISYNKKIIYKGQLKGDLPHGCGVGVLEKKVYHGEWKDGKRDGYASLLDKNQNITFTYWEEDNFVAELPPVEPSDFCVDVGSAEYDRQMLQYDTEKIKFALAWENFQNSWNEKFTEKKVEASQKEASFSITSSEEQAVSFIKTPIYEGAQINKQFHGLGRLKNSKGFYYFDGEFIEGKREGFGTFLDENGEKKSGYWKENKILGFHIITRKLTSDVQQTILIYPSPSSERVLGEICENNIARYYGEMKDEIPNGYGVRVYEESMYNGEWREGKRHGLGYVSLKSGGFIFGLWKNDEEENCRTFPNLEVFKNNGIDPRIISGFGEVLTFDPNFFEDDFIGELPSNIRYLESRLIKLKATVQKDWSVYLLEKAKFIKEWEEFEEKRMLFWSLADDPF